MANDVIMYNTEDGKTKIELHLRNHMVWLSQLEIAELFQTSKQNISKHIKSILADRELDEKVVVNYQLMTTQHGAIKGKISRKSANEKVDNEFKKYQDKHHEVTRVDKDYFDALTKNVKQLKK